MRSKLDEFGALSKMGIVSPMLWGGGTPAEVGAESGIEEEEEDDNAAVFVLVATPRTGICGGGGKTGAECLPGFHFFATVPGVFVNKSLSFVWGELMLLLLASAQHTFVVNVHKHRIGIRQESFLPQFRPGRRFRAQNLLIPNPNGFPSRQLTKPGLDRLRRTVFDGKNAFRSNTNTLEFHMLTPYQRA